MALNDRPDLSDDTLRGFLEARSERAGTDGLLASVRAEVATTRQRPSPTFGFQPSQARWAVGTGLVGLLVLAVAIGLASRSSDQGTSTASDAPPAALTPASSVPEARVVLSVAELNAVRIANPDALKGQVLVIDGTIVGEGASCTTGFLPHACVNAGAHLAGSNPDMILQPSATAGVGPWSGTGPSISGTFAAVQIDNNALQYLGRVESSLDDMGFLPSQLPDPSNAGSGVVGEGYWLVHGWIAGLGVTPSCPSAAVPASTAGPQYACGGLPALLSDDSRQPVQVTAGGFSVDGGSGSIVVQNGAYEGFAPAPLTIGIQTRPEEATFLVQQTYVSTCPPGSSCGLIHSDFHWAISSRIDPLPADVPPPNHWEAGQPVLPLTADQLDAILLANSNALMGRELVITGVLLPERAPCLPGSCDSATLSGTSPAITVIGSPARPLAGEGALTTFAARMGSSRILSYEGPVGVGFAGSPLSPSELGAQEGATHISGLQLVEGWITGRLDPLPCPKQPVAPSPGPQWGCGETAILSDSDIQPQTSDSFTIPPTSLQVQNGAYQDFAPGPASPVDPTSSALHLSEPELATFLVMPVYETSCPPSDFCPFQPLKDHFQIVGRVDPWPAPGQTVAPEPGPSSSPAAVQPVQPLTVAQLNAFMAMNSQSPDGRQLVVTGTIKPMTPLPSCVPLLSGCPPYILVGSDPLLTIPRPGGIGPNSYFSPVIGVPSTFAATLVNGTSLRYDGPVDASAGGQAWLPSQLLDAPKPDVGNGYWLVHGWVSVSSIIPACGIQIRPTPLPSLPSGCGPLEFLGDDGSTPVGPSASSVEVQMGAYRDFAPEPSATPPGGPEEGTFLLQTTSIQSSSPQWKVVARIDPWPVPALP